MTSAGRIIEVPSPAKLNLFLHILGQREDGYHELQTVFQFVDLCDEMGFELTGCGKITLEGNVSGVAVEENLIVRAAQAILPYREGKSGIRIHIKKRIPQGAGLGGGSSNAATTLLALNQLWNCHLDSAKLLHLALDLGADVPIFVFGRAAWAEGVGEQFVSVDPIESWYLVIYPGIAVNTAAIFRDPDLTRNSAAITIPAFFQHGGSNDCEPVVRRLHTEVDQALSWLEQRTEARLTGTGSCVFGRFDAKEQAREALDSLPGQWQGFVTSARNQSPAHLALKI